MSQQQTYSLSDIDRLFHIYEIAPLSLSPEKELITPFVEFSTLIKESPLELEIQELFINSLYTIVASEIENFPSNIFWDHDYFIGDALNQIQEIDKDKQVDFINLFEKSTTRLMRNFGIHSKIKFKYIHDFIFGYDWSKWVSDSPNERKHLTPFSIDFLDYIYNRGLELIELIKVNDEKYGALVKNRFRNPFTFIRKPAAESELLKKLAEETMIPVKTWLINSHLEWDKPYYIYRKETAALLNLNKNG